MGEVARAYTHLVETYTNGIEHAMLRDLRSYLGPELLGEFFIWRMLPKPRLKDFIREQGIGGETRVYYVLFYDEFRSNPPELKSRDGFVIYAEDQYGLHSMVLTEDQLTVTTEEGKLEAANYGKAVEDFLTIISRIEYDKAGLNLLIQPKGGEGFHPGRDCCDPHRLFA